jgi:hypothetical protein
VSYFSEFGEVFLFLYHETMLSQTCASTIRRCPQVYWRTHLRVESTREPLSNLRKPLQPIHTRQLISKGLKAHEVIAIVRLRIS